ncbi:MAG: sulfotransferase [Rhizomicrobium sp.]
MTPVYERMPSSVFPLYRRQFHAFCVGIARSGTVSITDQFPAQYRVAHEPESRFLTDKIVAYRRGRITSEKMSQYLRRRDRRMQLEMDSSYLNSEVVEFLAQAFPEAKFILTLRDCFSWVDSFTNFFLNRPEFMMSKRHVQRHMALLFGEPPYEFSQHDRALERAGLHPLRRYLRYWRDHNRRVLDVVPDERLLIVKTNDIEKSGKRLERFLRLPHNSLRLHIHANSALARHGLIGQIDPGYVRESIMDCCGDLMAEFFPEMLNLASDAGDYTELAPPSPRASGGTL